MTALVDHYSNVSAANAPPRGLSRVGDVFAIDLRSLAVLRIGIGLLILIDLALRLPDIRNFYSNDGIFPVAALRLTGDYTLSLHAVSGALWVQWLLIACQALAAVFVVVGFHTRISTIVCFALFASLLNRNPLVAHGGDAFLRVILFWMIFLPTQARWSIDARRRKRPLEATQTRSVCSAALLLQICIVYWFTALLKAHPIWWQGEAIGYALQLDIFATRFGRWLLRFPELLQLMTWGVLTIEIIGPLIALSPWKNARLRMIAIALFIVLHLGLAMCLELGLFPYACAAAWLVFLPGEFWNAVLRRRDVAKIATEYQPRVSTQVFVAVVYLYVVAWNVRTLDFDRFGPYYPEGFNFLGETLQVDQYWALFAPYPVLDDGWYVIPATLADGSVVDLHTAGAPVRWDKPARVAGTYRNPRWRKYLNQIYLVRYSEARRYFAQYLAREWNANHPPEKHVKSLEICYMLERTLSPTAAERPRRVVLWTHEWPVSSTQPATAPSTRPADR